ncbi:hemin uptake protein HemP [Tranquillimonas alkanivorans]|nr:hemin uptake protein HemP [Tranquillimonas alkanivorans]
MRVCGTQASGLHDSEPTPHYDARDLVRSGNTALVELDGQLYTLRITRSGKLILTK